MMKDVKVIFELNEEEKEETYLMTVPRSTEHFILKVHFLLNEDYKSIENIKVKTIQVI